MSDITLHIGDVFEQLAKIPDGSIDLIVTSAEKACYDEACLRT